MLAVTQTAVHHGEVLKPALIGVGVTLGLGLAIITGALGHAIQAVDLFVFRRF